MDKIKTKLVKEGESVSFDPSEIRKPNDLMMWYFNDIVISEITGDQSKICTDVQCKERFRDRLKLDHQTGSLNITNTRNKDSGVYQLQIISKRCRITKRFTLIDSHAETPVLNQPSDVTRKVVKCVSLLAMIVAVVILYRKKSTDLAVKGESDNLKTDPEIQRDELQNHTHWDSSESTEMEKNEFKLFSVTVSGVHGVNEHEVNVMEGVSVTLNTDVATAQQGEIRWYYNDTLIAEITGDQSQICTDVQCEERFRDRLELDHQTGSLTITNTRNTDAGVYHIQFNSSSDREKIFNVIVWGLSVGKQMNVAEGGSILSDVGVMKQNEMVTWYFNDTLIALVTGDLSKICTDVQWKDSNDRFRDRLKLNYQFSWSLIITNMSSTDSGLYTLKINRGSYSIMSSVTVTVTVPSLIPAAVATAVLLVAVCSCCTQLQNDRMQRNDQVKSHLH